MCIFYVPSCRELWNLLRNIFISLSIFDFICPLRSKQTYLLLKVWFYVWKFFNLKSLSFRWRWKWWSFSIVLSICSWKFLCHIKTIIWIIRLLFSFYYNFSISLRLFYCVSASWLIFIFIGLTELRFSHWLCFIIFSVNIWGLIFLYNSGDYYFCLFERVLILLIILLGCLQFEGIFLLSKSAWFRICR